MKASSTCLLLIVVTVAMSRARLASGNPASSGQEIISNEIPELHGGARPENGPKKVVEGSGTVTGAGRFPFPFHAFVQAAQFLQNSDISHPQHREPHIVDNNHRRQTVSPVPPRRHHISPLPSQPVAASIVQPQTTASPVVSVPTAPLTPEEDLNRIAGTVINSVLEHKAQIITSLVNLINWLLGGFLTEIRDLVDKLLGRQSSEDSEFSERREPQSFTGDSEDGAFGSPYSDRPISYEDIQMVGRLVQDSIEVYRAWQHPN